MTVTILPIATVTLSRCQANDGTRLYVSAVIPWTRCSYRRAREYAEWSVIYRWIAWSGPAASLVVPHSLSLPPCVVVQPFSGCMAKRNSLLFVLEFSVYSRLSEMKKGEIGGRERDEVMGTYHRKRFSMISKPPPPPPSVTDWVWSFWL